MYFDRNATQSPAKRGGSAGMHRPSNAAWVLPQAVNVMGAGFALPRGAGLKTGVPGRPARHPGCRRPGATAFHRNWAA